jgi:hypothetical protein
VRARRNLSVLQFARCAVHSYPHFPDAVSLCSLLAGVRLVKAQPVRLAQQPAAAQAQHVLVQLAQVRRG